MTYLKRTRSVDEAARFDSEEDSYDDRHALRKPVQSDSSVSAWYVKITSMSTA